MRIETWTTQGRCPQGLHSTEVTFRILWALRKMKLPFEFSKICPLFYCLPFIYIIYILKILCPYNLVSCLLISGDSPCLGQALPPCQMSAHHAYIVLFPHKIVIKSFVFISLFAFLKSYLLNFMWMMFCLHLCTSLLYLLPMEVRRGSQKLQN